MGKILVSVNHIRSDVLKKFVAKATCEGRPRLDPDPYPAITRSNPARGGALRREQFDLPSHLFRALSKFQLQGAMDTVDRAIKIWPILPQF